MIFFWRKLNPMIVRSNGPIHISRNIGLIKTLTFKYGLIGLGLQQIYLGLSYLDRRILFRSPMFLFHHFDFLISPSIKILVSRNRIFFVRKTTSISINRIFPDFNLENFRFLRTKIFIKDKIRFLKDKKDSWGLLRNLHLGMHP
jgi:hypothetical protein